MKIRLRFSIFILSLTMSSLAWARLGETPEQMVARLGPPTPQKGIAQVYANGHTYPYGENLNFSKEGWSIGCVMVNGICAKITYIKNAPFTDDDINTILGNEAQGFQWKQSTSSTTIIDSIFVPQAKVREWKRTDGGEAQIIDKSFTLTSPEFQRAIDAANQKAKVDAEQKMPNL